MNIPLILFLVLCWPEEVNSRVSYSLKLISFSNPDGTSWDQLRYHGNRRLCDSRSTDECDTYFKICIQMRGKCFINHDSKVYPNSNNITFGNDATWTGTTNNWDSNLRSFINPFDKDSPNKPGDLIDILNFPLSVWPGLKQECTGHQPIVMTNHTTLIMEFKAWCSPGYSGPGCTFRYTGSDPYGSCNNGSMNLQCANEEPAIVRYSSYTPSNSTSIQSFEQHIGAFLKNHICDTLRLDSKQSLWSHSRVGFIAKCGDKPVDPIVVQAALGTGGYQNQGSLKIVPTPLNNYRQGMNVVAIFAVKIQSYTNQDRTCKTKGTRKCCDGGNLPHCDTDTCDTHFRICVNNDIHNTGSGSCITTRVRPDTNELSTCGDVRVNHTTNQLDVASTYISVTEFWTWNNTYIHVEVRDADDGNKYDTVDVLTLKQDLTPGHWDLSGATAESVQLHGHVSLRLRLLVWCAAHKYGKNCDVQCTPSGHGSCDPDTGAAVCQSGYAGSGCHDIDECKEHYCHGPGTHRCNNLAGSYQCNCNGGWTGKNCSQDVDECNKNPCHHGGTCNNTVGSYTCLCPQGYTGKNCDHDVDECQHNPCQHGGTCHNTAGSYTCTCHGFDGKNCTQDIDECQAQNPCHHGGTCINTIGSYTCSCHGFTGKSCESDIDECQHLTCPHDHMHCVNTVGSYQCPCNTGWTGDQCNTDVNECGHNPCHHGGTCNNTVGSYTCLCQRGYAGKTCVHDIDECQHNPCQNGGKCQNTPGSYTCRCHGFGGKTCTHDIDECQTQHPCQHGGTCTNTVGSYTCSCHGFTGKNCENDIDECQHNPCQNGGKCHNTVGSYTCSCHGFTGKNCENDINECQLNPCQNGGKCHNTAGSYTCRCHGFGGKTCTRDIDECQTQHPCQHGGTCNNTVGSYKCLCVTGWTGTQCNTDVNECHNNPCQHGGTCNNVDGNYTCQCRTGWTGRNCDRDVNECETKPHVCQNGGTCHNTDGGYHCSCSPGWTGHTCTSDVDECHQHVCKNNATCNNTHGSYKCLCTKGWHGDTCNEDVNECTQHNPCEHHSQCTNTNGDYHCKCNTYWTGKNCSEDVNECNSANTCHHGGTCSNHNNGFSCSCTTGWTGKTCETDVDECKNQGICHNRGQCINDIGSFRCNCTHGWTGNICQTDIDECHPSQCLHGATCENSDGSFKCNCPPGWTGHLCEHDLDECQHNTCQHNSNCTNTEGDYTCKCDGHWTGKNCTEDIDECKNNPPCHNGGTCSNHVGGFSCSCHKGWTGNTCESDVDECKTNPPCHNGGTCSNSQGGFLCSCTKGWTGHTCDSDVNECENHRLCHNGGKCINTNGGFICNCTHGWTGDLCQTDFNECEHNPCLHHGRCQNTGGSFNCHCLPGWTGHLCDEDVNECQHNPCQYNGNCTNTEGDYTCKCDAHWTGKNCTEDIDECVTNHPCHNGGTCSNHVGGFSCSCPKGWAGNTCESDVDECELFNRCNGSDLCVNIRGSFLCSGSSESTTSNYSSSTSTMAYSYESYVDAISLQCSEDAWKVHIHVPELYKRHVDFDPSDIYLGEPGCEGYRSGDFLVIYQQYSNCLTHHSMTSGSDVYTNTLVYALRDANYKFIIREFRFRIDLECNMAKQVTVSQHFIETNNQVRRRSNNPRISGHGYYNVLMAFYRDPNFLHQMTGHSVMDTSPLPVDIGTDIYVKLATHVTNTDVKMRLDVCYTLPSPGAGDSLKFYLIRNACVTDVNTRVLSILPHETKFVFRDFEYSTDLHNLYLYCTVTFCNRTDNSSLCDEQCHQRSPRSVVYPANGRYLHRISTSRVIPRPNVKGQRTSIPDEPGQSESHKHTGGIIFISSVLLVAVSVTSAILMMIQLRQNHERHDDDTNDI